MRLTSLPGMPVIPGVPSVPLVPGVPSIPVIPCNERRLEGEERKEVEWERSIG